MHFRILLVACLVMTMTACNQKPQTAVHDDHENETATEHEHEEVKFQYACYSQEYELFAEADAFVAGEPANVLSHLSALPDFKAVENGKITLTLDINGRQVSQTLDQPTRKGIYSFDLQPETQGTGRLRYEISNEKGNFEIVVPNVTVFANDEQAHEAAEKAAVSKTNTTVFTKEQSWKINYATDYPHTEPFGQVIKTTALVESSPGNEMIVSAKINGVVKPVSENMLEGLEVKAGQALFSIAAGDLADNNITVKYSEAKSNFEKASSDYERAKELAKDKIVSEKDLISYKNQYENTKAVYDHLNKNFNSTGQKVSSPMNGFIKQLFVKNGSYVEAGQPLVSVSQNKTLLLSANVPQKYASVLGNIQSANIRTLNDNQTYSFEQLNGKILSYGKSANSDNYMLPVSLQIDNTGSFHAGSFVEVYLKTVTNTQAMTVPNTALMEEQGNFFVWVQVNPELFEKREVMPGKTDGLRTEILSGILLNERVVTKGAILIKLAQATGTLDAHSGHVH